MLWCENVQIEAVLGMVGQCPHIQPHALPFVDSEDPAVSTLWIRMTLHFFTVALDFALFPRAGRRANATVPNSDSQTTARQWVTHQVRGCMMHPSREPAEVIDEISVALSATLRRMGRCRYPLNITSAVSAGIFGLWRTARVRRMEIIPLRASPLMFEGRSHLY